MDSILQKHRKEIRDLTASITGLKKQATKKTRKGVLSKCAAMEEELKIRHAKEISEYNGNHEEEVAEEEVTPEALLANLSLAKETVVESEVGSKVVSQPPTTAAPKRNRAKERLAKRQAEIDRLTEEARIEASVIPDYKKIEEDGMNDEIVKANLTLYEIQPDGNCLFSSIKDQLENSSNYFLDKPLLVQELRNLAGAYILKNKSTFEPFMFNEETFQLDNIDDYVERLQSTSMWGSDKEILAFSKIFNVSISVLSFDTTLKRSNTLVINEDELNETRLNLAYYKHSYGLGEHYNSLRSNV